MRKFGSDLPRKESPSSDHLIKSSVVGSDTMLTSTKESARASREQNERRYEQRVSPSGLREQTHVKSLLRKAGTDLAVVLFGLVVAFAVDVK